MHSPGELPGVTSAVDQDKSSAVDNAHRFAGRLRLFAVLLGMPESDSLQVLDDLRTEHDWLGACCDELQETPFEHWQAEHTRLFVTGFPKTVCPPFKSAYSGQGMSGSAVVELAGFYRSIGLSARKMPPDYLGTILECWAYLTEQANEDALATLWGQHLASWLPRFAGDLRQSAELLLYRLFGEQLELLCASQSEDPGADSGGIMRGASAP